MARDVVDAVVSRAAARVAKDARAKRLPLPGGDFASLDDLIADAARATERRRARRRIFTTSYGTRWRDVWSEISERRRRDATATTRLPYTVGEAAATACVTRWRARSATCSFVAHISRSRHATTAIAAAERAATIAAPLLGWDRDASARAIDDYAAEVERICSASTTRSSPRIATSGSTRAARRAGNQLASMATMPSTAITPPSVTGSSASTPNSSDRDELPAPHRADDSDRPRRSP